MININGYQHPPYSDVRRLYVQGVTEPQNHYVMSNDFCSANAIRSCAVTELMDGYPLMFSYSQMLTESTDPRAAGFVTGNQDKLKRIPDVVVFGVWMRLMRRSVYYDLPDVFLLTAVADTRTILSWSETKLFAQEMGFTTVPEIYVGNVFNTTHLLTLQTGLSLAGGSQYGFVIRYEDSFATHNASFSFGKFFYQKSRLRSLTPVENGVTPS